MKVYRQGPNSATAVDYVVILDDHSVPTWYEEDKSRYPSTGYPILRWKMKKYIRGNMWKNVRMTQTLKVLLRMCKTEEIYQTVIAYSDNLRLKRLKRKKK